MQDSSAAGGTCILVEASVGPMLAKPETSLSALPSGRSVHVGMWEIPKIRDPDTTPNSRALAIGTPITRTTVVETAMYSLCGIGTTGVIEISRNDKRCFIVGPVWVELISLSLWLW